MHLTPEPPARMEKSANVQHNDLSKPRTRHGKGSERGATPAPRGQRQRAPKANRHPEASPARKKRSEREKPNQTNESKVGEEDIEEKLRSTVVDIDRVRDDDVKEENLGLLEAAEQEEGELKQERSL